MEAQRWLEEGGGGWVKGKFTPHEKLLIFNYKRIKHRATCVSTGDFEVN